MVYLSRMKTDKPRSQLLGANGTVDGSHGVSMDGTSQGSNTRGTLPGMPSVHAEGSRERGVERTRTLSLSLARLSQKDKQKREYIVRHGAIPTLVQLAKANPDDAQVQASCAAAFVNFARDPAMRQEIIDCGGGSVISSLSHSGDKTVHADYLTALINLTATSHNENDLVSHGAVRFVFVFVFNTQFGAVPCIVCFVQGKERRREEKRREEREEWSSNVPWSSLVPWSS